MPALDKWLGKNPKWPRSLYKFDDFSVAAGFSVERFMERMQNPELGNGKKDFLNGFLEAKKEFPDLVTDNEVIGYMIINVSVSWLRCGVSRTNTAPVDSGRCRYPCHCDKRYLLPHPQVISIQRTTRQRTPLCTSLLPYIIYWHRTATLPGCMHQRRSPYASRRGSYSRARRPCNWSCIAQRNDIATRNNCRCESMGPSLQGEHFRCEAP